MSGEDWYSHFIPNSYAKDLDGVEVVTLCGISLKVEKKPWRRPYCPECAKRVTGSWV